MLINIKRLVKAIVKELDEVILSLVFTAAMMIALLGFLLALCYAILNFADWV